MDSKKNEDVKSGKFLLKLELAIEKATSKLKESGSSKHENMDSKKNFYVKFLIKSRKILLKLQQAIEKANSKLIESGSSSSASHDLQNLSQEVQQLLIKTAKNAPDPSKPTYHIRHELEKVFAAEEVGHSCDLCQTDLARDPERPGASLLSLNEACVLACGHVYHFKCLEGTTLDLHNHSTNPSCIFCISSSN